MAKDDKPKKKKSPLRTAGMIIISLIAIVFLQMTFVLFIVGMLPSIVMNYIDQSELRHRFHTVFACNLSGVLPFIVQLVTAHNETTTMYAMLKDPKVLFIMWFTAVVGYVLLWAAPKIARMIIMSVNEQKLIRFRSVQDKLLQEWGTGIAYLDEEEALKHSIESRT